MREEQGEGRGREGSRCRYKVAVGHNIITKEETTERYSVLVYIPIIDY